MAFTWPNLCLWVTILCQTFISKKRIKLKKINTYFFWYLPALCTMQHGSSVMSLCRAVGNKPDSDAHARQEAPVVALSDSLRTCNDVTGTDCITWWRSRTSRCRPVAATAVALWFVPEVMRIKRIAVRIQSPVILADDDPRTDSDTSPADPLAQKPIVRFICYAPAPRVGGIKRWCASDVWRLSVAYIGP